MADMPLKMFKPSGRDLGLGMSGSRASQMPDNDADDMNQNAGGKISADEAGYMELDGAVKDADCSHVEVDGGVSSDLGCCNDYDPEKGAQEFKCGACTFVMSADNMGDNGGSEGSGPTTGQSGANAGSDSDFA